MLNIIYSLQRYFYKVIFYESTSVLRVCISFSKISGYWHAISILRFKVVNTLSWVNQIIYPLEVVGDEIFICIANYLWEGVSHEMCMWLLKHIHVKRCACVCNLWFIHLLHLSFIWILYISYELGLLSCN